MKKTPFILLLCLIVGCFPNARAHPLQEPDPQILVIFGATGDLAQRKIFPALYQLAVNDQLPRPFVCVGVGRREKTDAQFQEEVKKAAKAQNVEFQQQFHYFKGDFDNPNDYEKLSAYLADLDKRHGTQGNRLFYLATPPSAFAPIVDQLDQHQMLQTPSKDVFARVVIEKPFGRDYSSAQALQDTLSKHVDEEQIYRIDHYLGKGVVQEILPTKKEFDSLLNNQHVDHVSIILSEELGVGTRGRLMEESGALRDLVQNHVMQMFALLAMELPTEWNADEIQNEKVKLLQATRLENIVRGQYGSGFIKGQAVVGYREEDEVARDSNVETFVGATLFVDTPRWKGIPFEIKAGKRLDRSLVEIAIHFNFPKQVTLLFRVQPDAAIYLTAEGETADYRDLAAYPDPYATLLYDAMRGDKKLFVGFEELLAAWALFTPILEKWEQEQEASFPNYPAGSSGVLNQAAANRATSSSVPGSSKRWVAPGIMSRRFSHVSSKKAFSLSSITP